MKYNRTVVETQLRNKLSQDFMSAIVMESFIKGLAFDKPSIGKNMTELGNYCKKVTNKMDLVAMLESAIVHSRNENNIFHEEYLVNMKNTMLSIVNEAVEKNIDEADDDMEAEEIISNGTLAKVDSDKLLNASSDIGVDEISQIIKEKVVATISDEKVAFDNAEKLKEEIKEMVRNVNSDSNTEASEDESHNEEVVEDGAEDIAAESYIKDILHNDYAKDHKSLFTKINDICMESFLYTKEETTSEIPFDTLAQITMEATFPIFNEADSIEEVLESFNRISPDSMPNTMPVDELSKKSLIATICIMKLFEVLKTIHFYKPSAKDINAIMSRDVDIVKMYDKDFDSLPNMVPVIRKLIRQCESPVASDKIDRLEKAICELDCMKENIIKMAKDDNPKSKDICEFITNSIGKMKMDIEKCEKQLSVPVKTIAMERAMERNKVSLEQAIKILRRKPTTESISCIVDSSHQVTRRAYENVIQLVAYNSQNIRQANYSITLEQVVNESLASLLQNTAKEIENTDNVSIYFSDRGYSANIEK